MKHQYEMSLSGATVQRKEREYTLAELRQVRAHEKRTRKAPPAVALRAALHQEILRTARDLQATKDDGFWQKPCQICRQVRTNCSC